MTESEIMNLSDNEFAAFYAQEMARRSREAAKSCPTVQLEGGRQVHGDDCDCLAEIVAEMDRLYGSEFDRRRPAQ